MKMHPFASTLLVATVALGASGCWGGHHHRDQSTSSAPMFKPQPQEGYLSTAPGEYQHVPQAPPEVIVEVQPARPSGSYVWQSGAWRWSGQHYDWQQGQWQQPPAGYTTWVNANYERRAEGTYYAHGYWQNDNRHNGNRNDFRDGNERRGMDDDHGHR